MLGVKIKDDILVFQIGDDFRKVPFGDIALIGEYTYEHGLFFGDDHFIMFFDKNGSVFEVSLDQYLEIEEGLSKELGEKLEIKFVLNISFQSRVIYPHEMKDKVIWTPRRNKSFLDKVGYISTSEVEMELNKELIEFIDRLKK